ncbi:hypothetical protein ACFW3E_37665, partial [Streptomyces sp. NPDC058861]
MDEDRDGGASGKRAADPSGKRGEDPSRQRGEDPSGKRRGDPSGQRVEGPSGRPDDPPSRLPLLLEAVLCVGTDLELRATLQHVVDSATELIGARYGALGVVDPQPHPRPQLVTAGMSAEERRAGGGPPPR